ncbi:5-oxoprolinase subunit PxpB [uncultured Eudoraea sp.]|uniref:5-oxoprolinase subunit PxpB n=1 Tax=uncultured Eudoraea sp. TaxID=1035614 RepID=UPI00261DFE08|nr:5-oxoprolinase subunit PxpB [uncultured Eudoraea sp.]
MSSYPISIRPFGEQAILIEWPNEVSEAILYDILDFAESFKLDFKDALNWELVPSYNSLTLINRNKSIEFSKIRFQIEECYKNRKVGGTPQRYLWKLPVCYDLEFGIDLEEVSRNLGKRIEEIIKAHTEHIYTVYGIGFLPGFMYLGGLPGELETPRKSVPRLSVPKGSVGLAGKQTGIYPQESPGGWNIIGNCPIALFNVNLAKPCFVSVGDQIQFYAVTRAEYDLHKIETEVGIYNLDKIKLDD